MCSHSLAQRRDCGLARFELLQSLVFTGFGSRKSGLAIFGHLGLFGAQSQCPFIGPRRHRQRSPLASGARTTRRFQAVYWKTPGFFWLAGLTNFCANSTRPAAKAAKAASPSAFSAGEGGLQPVP